MNTHEMKQVDHTSTVCASGVFMEQFTRRYSYSSDYKYIQEPELPDWQDLEAHIWCELTLLLYEDYNRDQPKVNTEMIRKAEDNDDVFTLQYTYIMYNDHISSQCRERGSDNTRMLSKILKWKQKSKTKTEAQKILSISVQNKTHN